MIEVRLGDIFAQPDLDYVAHQCNLYHTFGSGIANTIKEKFPWAYEADIIHGIKGDMGRLGSYGIVDDPKCTRHGIINLYCQTGLHATDRVTHYAAMGKVLFDLEQKFVRDHFPGDNPTVIGIPYGIGCGLANGQWPIVEHLIYSAFEDSFVHVVICRLNLGGNT